MPRYQRGKGARTTNRAPVVTRLSHHLIESYASIDDFPLISQPHQHQANQTKKRPRTTSQNQKNSTCSTPNVDNLNNNNSNELSSHPSTPLSPTSSSLGGKLPPDTISGPKKCCICLSQSLQTCIITCSACTFASHIFCLDPILPELQPNWLCISCKRQPIKWKQNARMKTSNILNQCKDQLTDQFLFHLVRSIELETDIIISSADSHPQQNNINTITNNNNNNQQIQQQPQKTKQTNQQTIKEDPTALATTVENNPEHTSNNNDHQQQQQPSSSNRTDEQTIKPIPTTSSNPQPPVTATAEKPPLATAKASSSSRQPPTRRSFPRAAKERAARATRQGPNTRSATSRQRETTNPNPTAITTSTPPTPTPPANGDPPSHKRLKKSHQIMEKIKSSQKEEREQREKEESTEDEKIESQSNNEKRKKPHGAAEQDDDSAPGARKKAKIDCSVDADGQSTKRNSSDREESTLNLDSTQNLNRRTLRPRRRIMSRDSDVESGIADEKHSVTAKAAVKSPSTKSEERSSEQVKESAITPSGNSAEKGLSEVKASPPIQAADQQTTRESDKSEKNDRKEGSVDHASTHTNKPKVNRNTVQKVISVSNNTPPGIHPQIVPSQHQGIRIGDGVDVKPTLTTEASTVQPRNATSQTLGTPNLPVLNNTTVPSNVNQLSPINASRKQPATHPVSNITMDPKHQALFKFAADLKQRPKQTDRARLSARFRSREAHDKTSKVQQWGDSVPQSERQRMHATSIVASARQRDLQPEHVPEMVENKYSKASIQSLLGDKDDNTTSVEKREFPPPPTPFMPLSGSLAKTLAQKQFNSDMNRGDEQEQGSSFSGKCGIMRQTNTAAGPRWQYVTEGREKRRSRVDSRTDGESSSREVEIVSVSRNPDSRRIQGTSASSWGDRTVQNSGHPTHGVVELSPIESIKENTHKSNPLPNSSGDVIGSEGRCFPSDQASNYHLERSEQNPQPRHNAPIIIDLDGPDTIQPINQPKPFRSLSDDHSNKSSDQQYNILNTNRNTTPINKKFTFNQTEPLLPYSAQANLAYNHRLRDVEERPSYLEINRDHNPISSTGMDLGRDVDPMLRPARKSNALYLPTAQRRAQYERGRALAMMDRGEVQPPFDGRRITLSRNDSYTNIPQYGQDNGRFQPPFPPGRMQDSGTNNTIPLPAVGSSLRDRDMTRRTAIGNSTYGDISPPDLTRPNSLVNSLRQPAQNSGFERSYDAARGPSTMRGFLPRPSGSSGPGLFSSIIGRDFKPSGNGLESNGIGNNRYDQNDPKMDQRPESTKNSHVGGHNETKGRNSSIDARLRKLEAMQPPVPTMVRPSGPSSLVGLNVGEFDANGIIGTPLHQQIPKVQSTPLPKETRGVGDTIIGTGMRALRPSDHGLPGPGSKGQSETKSQEGQISQQRGMVLQLCHPPPMQLNSKMNENGQENKNGQNNNRRSKNGRFELPPISSLKEFQNGFGSNRQ